MKATGMAGAGNKDKAEVHSGAVQLPKAPGTYALILRCDAPDRRQVGALGSIEIRPGYYIYVGSALGPGGIRARVSRHLRKAGKLHWHIDYLRPNMPVVEIWFAEAALNLEHAWAEGLRQWDLTGIPAAGFGASDCRCESHLFYCDARPMLEHIRERLVSPVRQRTTVRSVTPDHRAF